MSLETLALKSLESLNQNKQEDKNQPTLRGVHRRLLSTAIAACHNDVAKC